MKSVGSKAKYAGAASTHADPSNYRKLLVNPTTHIPVWVVGFSVWWRIFLHHRKVGFGYRLIPQFVVYTFEEATQRVPGFLEGFYLTICFTTHYAAKSMREAEDAIHGVPTIESGDASFRGVCDEE